MRAGPGVYGHLSPKEAYPIAKTQATKALEIDDTLAEAYTSLAWAELAYDWDWSGAERDFKRAIGLSPGYATAHHWYGGTWIMGTHYGPETKGGQTNPDTLDGFPTGRITDAEFISYLDDCETYKHNGLLLKTALFPLENDKLSWDLDWIQRGNWLVEEMAARGIYCQVNFFDTWACHKDYWFKWTWPGSGESGSLQPFNVWASGDEAAKENYIRYLVARYSGYYNVYFELGNEMEHSPNSGSAFVAQANSNYIPWYRSYDPYGLPIGLSETGIGESSDADIVFVHQTGTFPSTSVTQPWIMNELVSGWSGGGLYDDGVMRSSSNRLGYRRTFWRMFVYGGVGSSEATWLNIGNALNSAVYDVMGDQMRLRDFNEALPSDINDMVTDTSFVVSGPGTYRTRREAGECYVTYYLGSSAASNTTVNLPAGDYFTFACVRPMIAFTSTASNGLESTTRSEERRVGKECRSRWSPYH